MATEAPGGRVTHSVLGAVLVLRTPQSHLWHNVTSAKKPSNYLS